MDERGKVWRGKRTKRPYQADERRWRVTMMRPHGKNLLFPLFSTRGSQEVVANTPFTQMVVPSDANPRKPRLPQMPGARRELT